jgi:hypothetical protein
MYHTTGFSHDEIVDLCILVNSAERVPGALKWPPILGLFKSVSVALTYMRHNRTQAEIGESFGVSQPTISRAVSVVTPLFAQVLARGVPTADDLDPGTQYIVDGTLLPCWSWASHPELWSGKHKTTGMNVQVACTIYGQLAWISDPVNGSRHDNYCPGRIRRAAGTRPEELDRRQRLHRKRHDHSLQETGRRRASRLAEEIQHQGQRDPLDDRAGNLALQEPADRPHRLQAPNQHVRIDNLSRNWPALPQDRLNKPPGLDC